MGVLDKAKKLNKDWKNDKLAIMANVVPSYKRLNTGALGFDYPTGGGLPEGRIVTFAGVEHSGKAQPLDSPVLTPNGYKRMGDIAVGDLVIGRDGKAHEVTGVFPQGKKKVYRITFHDNTSTLCSDEHLWNINEATLRGTVKKVDSDLTWKTVELSELLDKPLTFPNSRNRYKYRIPVNSEVEFNSQKVPMDAYLLGCLLGDGSLSHGLGFTNSDEDILNKVNTILLRDYDMSLKYRSNYDYYISRRDTNNKFNSYYVFNYDGVIIYGINNLLDALAENGIKVSKYALTGERLLSTINSIPNLQLVAKDGSDGASKNGSRETKIHKVLSELELLTTSEHKFIPKQYLINDFSTRLAILQGLMDTDGFIDKNGLAYFDSSSRQLAEDVAFLVRSFGGIAAVTLSKSAYKKDGEIIPCNEVYSVTINKLSHDIPIVSCARKLERWKNYKIHQNRYKYKAITNIDYVGEQDCQCIYVDSDEHLYLTDDFIVTHNTTGACVQLAAFQHKYPDKVCVYVDVEHSLDIEFQCAMTGMDATRLLYVNPEGMSGEDIMDYILTLQDEPDIGLIVLDSIPALVSSRDYDTNVGEDKGMSAGIAKPLGKFIKKMVDQVSAKGNILILINQCREAGKTFTGATIYTEPGGHAPKYYSSVKVRFGTRKFTKGDNVDVADGEDADGFRLMFKITKNKTFSTQRGGGWLTFRYDNGLDWKHDLLEIAAKFDFIKRPNNQTYLLVDIFTGEVFKDAESGEDLKFRGKAAMLEYFDAHPAFQDKYIKMIQKAIAAPTASYGKLLDARDESAIDEQEQSVEGHHGQTEAEFLREQELMDKNVHEDGVE